MVLLFFIILDKNTLKSLCKITYTLSSFFTIRGYSDSNAAFQSSKSKLDIFNALFITLQFIGPFDNTIAQAILSIINPPFIFLFNSFSACLHIIS